IPVSRTRNEIMYSLTRFWIGPKEARIEIQVSVVVRTTRTSDRPSTPTWYWMPNSGIQSTAGSAWKPAFAPGNRTSIASETAHAAAEADEQQVVELVEPPLVQRAAIGEPRRSVGRRCLDRDVAVSVPVEVPEHVDPDRETERRDRDAGTDQEAVDAEQLELLG